MSKSKSGDKSITYVEPDYKEEQNIVLEVPDEPLKGNYETIVEAVTDSVIKIRDPSINNLYLPISPHRKVTLKHFNRAAAFESKTSIANREDSRSNPILSLKLPDQLKRIQRRNFVRVPCSFPVSVLILETPEDTQISRQLNLQAVDISAGGIQLQSETPLPEGTKLQLSFTLPNTKRSMTDLFGTVLRELDKEEKNSYYIAVEFFGIEEYQRNDIIQFVYSRERSNI